MMAERVVESGKAGSTGTNGGESEKSLKDKGNEFFKAGNYLKAAALYTQAIKLDPSNATLYRYSQITFTQCSTIFAVLRFLLGFDQK